MLSPPFSEPEGALRHVETFGDRKYVNGFMVTAVRTMPVHHNSYMKGLSGDQGGRAGARSSFRTELAGACVQELQSLPVGPRAELPLLRQLRPIFSSGETTAEAKYAKDRANYGHCASGKQVKGIFSKSIDEISCRNQAQ
jgi:hypothetical protein